VAIANSEPHAEYRESNTLIKTNRVVSNSLILPVYVDQLTRDSVVVGGRGDLAEPHPHTVVDRGHSRLKIG